MATYKVLLDKRRQLQDGTYPLVLRIWSGDRRRDINLKSPLKESEFDEDKQQVNSKHPNRKLINRKIQKALLQVQQTTLTLEIAEDVVTPEKIKNLVIKPASKLDFIAYGWQQVQELQQANRYGNSCIYRDALNALQKYSGKAYIPFGEMDCTFLKQVETKMRGNEVKVNTVALCLRTIRAIYNRAVKEKQVDKSCYPFDDFRITHEPTAKRNISKEDIAAIAQAKLPAENPQYHARNYFLLSFNLIGISFADMASIKPSDISNGRLIYQRRKTHKLYNIKLTDKAKEILALYQQPNRTYILPIIPEEAVDNQVEERKYIQYGTKTTNKYLRRIAKDLKIEQKITTYYSRHTWATVAKKLGYSKDLISEALGHSYGNKITEIYLDGFDQEVIDAMNEVICKL